VKPPAMGSGSSGMAALNFSVSIKITLIDDLETDQPIAVTVGTIDLFLGGLAAASSCIPGAAGYGNHIRTHANQGGR
jgi:hypothetical protein